MNTGVTFISITALATKQYCSHFLIASAARERGNRGVRKFSPGTICSVHKPRKNSSKC